MTCVFREQTRKCCLVTGLHLFLITLCLPLGHFLLQSSRTLLQRLVLFNITLLLSSLVILWVPRNYRMEPPGYFDDRMLCNMALKQRHKSGWNGEKWNNDGLNTDREMAQSSKCETTVFEIQTMDMCTPPPPLREPLLSGRLTYVIYIVGVSPVAVTANFTFSFEDRFPQSSVFVIILSLTPVHTLFVYVQYPSGSGWWCSSADGLVRWFKTVLSGCWRQVTIKKLKRPCQCKVLTSHTAFKQWHKTDENGDRLHKDGLNIVRDMVYSSRCKTTVFEIQTRNIHDSNPPPPLFPAPPRDPRW